MPHPTIIQGGMGVAVSGWQLARAVSLTGQLGVVSGTALALVLVRRLQCGDIDGHMRRALDHFPFPSIAARIIEGFYIPGGKAPSEKFRSLPFPNHPLHPALLEVTVAANFVEVYLAKEGHDGVVGINYLEKLQIPALASLYGAMLAGVDYIIMGAGIPRFIPGALDAFAQQKCASLKLDVQGATPDQYVSHFDPLEFSGGVALPALKRPYFFPVVSSATLAATLARKSNGTVDGFVVEQSSAGGHNAPPRGAATLNPRGEPIYGPRDEPEFDRYRALGIPFWLAGSFGQSGGLARALEVGATGIQVGTAFAFCQESGIDPILRQRVIEHARTATPDIRTDPLVSPTGFPFKVLELEGTLSEEAIYSARQRLCDLGYLRELYQKPDGELGYRCAAEPIDAYLHKGGQLPNTQGRKCLCNALSATIGLGQTLDDGTCELPIVTAGDHLHDITRFLANGQSSYSAADVIRCVLESSSAVDRG